ncbi:flagellar hook-basal body complex protein [Aliarcobacter cryaerophilus]|uniref:flagellar hook-basal body complex protein n=1 Tax=Aliarcobacter cryaerophilus TaxID=28198 RepID=UPI0021B1EF2D|nr:flagellar hook-basal body complex protein [Aliarcobacter cryaerophilus]MCT7499566.1 flagellar hook-basal body complex protein [Aliarcobacter cryaerophilus]MCT7543746.1 flagellar hook-basal body complex protein [Aliarcobacter cryaerophilus]
MIGAMWNGIAGIWQHDKGIAVESNNLANSNTVGHKKDQISFSDVLYNQAGFGKGVQTQTISKQFEQGNIVQSGVGIDVAIEGKGFFVVKSRENPNEIYYTRAGNLVQAKDGFLVTQDDYKIQGLVPQEKIVYATNSNIFTDSFTNNIGSYNINIGNSILNNINSKTTDYRRSAKDDTIDIQGNNYKSSLTKIKDADLLVGYYQKTLGEFSTNKEVQSQKRKISEIDLSSNLNNLNPSDNKISINIDGRLYSVIFDEANKNEAMKELSYKISQTTGFSSTFNNGILKIEQSEAMGKEFKVNSIDLNNDSIAFTSNDYEIYNNENPIPEVQNSTIDYTSKLSSINHIDNKLSINIEDETYSVNFDQKGYDFYLKDAEEKDAFGDMKKLYDFLSQKGKDKFGLEEPSTIPTWEMIEEKWNAILPSQTDIDSMPNGTPQEQNAKAQAQAKRDAAQAEYDKIANKRSEQFSKYSTADTIVSSLKDLSDKISNNVGFSSTVIDGVLDVKGLVPGEEFKVSNVFLNDIELFDVDTKSANKGFGIEIVNGATKALAGVVEKADAEFLQITNVLDYGNLGTVSKQDINVRLDTLGISDKSTAEVSISDDGFVFVTSGKNKFLVGRLSTAGFRNEQGLEPMGGNLFQASQYSGNAFNSDTMNIIRGGSLERANIDYGSTLTQIMVYQKAFEASSKSITTSDEFLQTAIQMKK